MPNSQQTAQSIPNKNSEFQRNVVIPVAAVLLSLAAGWVFVHRPAMRQVAALEQQCGELARLVEKIAGEEVAGDSGTVQRSNKLLQRLASQAATVESAEASMAKLNRFHQRFAQQLRNIEQPSRTLNRLAELENTLRDERRALALVEQRVNELTDTHRTLMAAGTTLPEIRSSLNQIDDLHVDLLSQRDDAIKAKRTLANLSQLCEALAASRSQVALAGEVTEQWAITQNKLAKQSDRAMFASQVVDGLLVLSNQLNDQVPTLAKSRRNLSLLTNINQQLAGESQNLTESVSTLEQLGALAGVVGQAATTVDDIQRLVVDVCLMQPAQIQSLASKVQGKADGGSATPTASLSPAPVEPNLKGAQAWSTMYQSLRIAAPMWMLR